MQLSGSKSLSDIILPSVDIMALSECAPFPTQKYVLMHMRNNVNPCDGFRDLIIRKLIGHSAENHPSQTVSHIMRFVVATVIWLYYNYEK